MYGTLSFGNGNKSKRSSAEFHTFSAFHRRRLRQPACDECRTARVKCRGDPDNENLKCARCQGTNRACTYNSASCWSRNSHSGKPTEPRETKRTASVTVEGNEDENGKENGKENGRENGKENRKERGKGNSLTPSIPESASSPSSTPTPQGPTAPQDTHTRWWESQYEPLDLFFDQDPATDKAIDGSPNFVPPNRVDVDVSSASVDDKDGVLHLLDLDSRQRIPAKLLFTNAVPFVDAHTHANTHAHAQFSLEHDGSAYRTPKKSKSVVRRATRSSRNSAAQAPHSGRHHSAFIKDWVFRPYRRNEIRKKLVPIRISDIDSERLHMSPGLDCNLVQSSKAARKSAGRPVLGPLHAGHVQMGGGRDVHVGTSYLSEPRASHADEYPGVGRTASRRFLIGQRRG
ncbi:hypothetical protein ACHAP3_007239 [Botrytis cinerea]